MPSFRVTITIGRLRPGVAPAAVEPAAAAAAESLTTLEASSVNVVRGAARLTIRFTAEDAELAHQVADHVVETVAESAEPVEWVLTVRARERWRTIDRGEA